MIKGLENNPRLAAIIEQGTEFLARRHARRERKAKGLALSPAAGPYYRPPGVVLAYQARAQQQFPEPRELPQPQLPYVPSPPIVPKYVSEDDARTERLKCVPLSDTTKAEQLNLF